jgi:hypothetical protein
VLAKSVALDPSLVDELTVAARVVSERSAVTSAGWRLLAA